MRALSLLACAAALMLVPGAAAEQFDSGELEPGQSWEYTFGQPAMFTFHDHKNPQAEGTVRVTSATNNTTELVTIQIRDAGGQVNFQPDTATIEAGSAVRWVNIGSDVHQVMGWTEGDEMQMAHNEHSHEDEGHGHEHDHAHGTAESRGVAALLVILAAIALFGRRRRA